MKLRLAMSGLVTLLCFMGTAQYAYAYDAPKRDVKLRITRVTSDASNQPLCDDFDYYLKTKIGGHQFGNMEVPFDWDIVPCFAFSYDDYVSTGDELSKTWSDSLQCDTAPIPIEIQLFERDCDCFPTYDGDDALAKANFNIDPKDPATWVGCHDEGGNGGFCWEVEVTEEAVSDQDGDGLLDIWELYGIDSNCDGEIVNGQDILLPQMGANPNHKDLFVEVNWYQGYAPSASVLDEVKYAFATAPVDAGGVANPDGLPGINIHFDAGLVMNDVGFYGIGGRELGPPADSPDSSAALHVLMRLKISSDVVFSAR